jgi:ankyrin repeat protein
VAVAAMLVAAGARVDMPDGEGHTALHVAAKAGQREMVEWLLDHGADADAKDRLTLKPLDYVAGATNAALAALLERRMKPRLEQGLPMKIGEAG